MGFTLGSGRPKLQAISHRQLRQARCYLLLYSHACQRMLEEVDDRMFLGCLFFVIVYCCLFCVVCVRCFFLCVCWCYNFNEPAKSCPVSACAGRLAFGVGNSCAGGAANVVNALFQQGGKLPSRDRSSGLAGTLVPRSGSASAAFIAPVKRRVYQECRLDSFVFLRGSAPAAEQLRTRT